MEQKKRLLYVIGGLSVGGAEKSTVNQLNEIDPDRFDVFLYVFNNSGLFKSQIPSFVKFIHIDETADVLMHSIFDWRYFIKKPVYWAKKIFRTCVANLFKGSLDINQALWRMWKDDVRPLDGDFDVAIGQQEGMPNYFVIDKVKAKRKILWIHSEYVKLKYSPSFDEAYFSNAYAVVTISELCKASLKTCFPLLDNFKVLPNITSPTLIRNMAQETVDDVCFDDGLCNIVSVGRLAYPKNFELAIEAAAILKKESFGFRWIIVGDGVDRNKLQQLIYKKGLSSEFLLIGVRANPYKYIAKSDIAVQTSIYEGKSIFADEAKILNRLFVSTPYDTVYDAITNNVTGIILDDMSAMTLASAIKRLHADAELCSRIKNNLSTQIFDTAQQIDNYYKVYGLAD